MSTKVEQVDTLPPLPLAGVVYSSYPVSDLLPLAQPAEGESLLDFHGRITADDFGDSLLQFLVRELLEGTERADGKRRLVDALRVLTNVQHDVSCVAREISRLITANGPEREFV